MKDIDNMNVVLHSYDKFYRIKAEIFSKLIIFQHIG